MELGDLRVMDDLLRPPVLLTLAFWALFLGVFFLALRRHWLSRFDRGFLATLLIGLVGVGGLSGLAVGVWGYEMARRVLHEQVVRTLENVGQIVEKQVEIDVETALAQMEALAGRLGPSLDAKDMALTQEELTAAQALNPRLLQIRLYDSAGQALAERSVTGAAEPGSRIAQAVSVEGRPFASDAYISPVFKRFVLNLSVPFQCSRSRGPASLGARYDLQEALLGLIRTARFSGSGYAVVVNSEGRILAHPDASRVNDDISGYEAVRKALRGERGSLFAVNKAGQGRLMFFRPLKSPATINPKPMALLTELEQGEAEQPLLWLRYRFLAAIGLLSVVSGLIALYVARSIRRPLNRLVEMAGQIQQGDLTASAAVSGLDEIGRLGVALDAMVQGLRERERIKEVFGQYVATQVSDKVLKGEVNLGGESRVVTILFSDIRGFTTMSEGMTPQQVVSFLNDYFSEMVDAVFEQGGMLDKFIGDGLMAVFNSLGDTPDHAYRAVMAALRMKALLAKINGQRAMAGNPPIAIGIGIHTDEVILGNIGSRKRLQYTAIGDGVNTCSRVESLNKEFGSTILITETTYEQVKDRFVCRQTPEAHLRGKTRPMRFYEVLSARQPEKDHQVV